jgi:arabinoxylan arabinofuranohydrolase
MASWNGPSQDVTSKLVNGKSYATNVWVRTQSGTPSAKATLAVTANGSTTHVQLATATAVNPSSWTLLSGTAATFYVETTSGTDSYHIDDGSFQ